MGAQDSKPEFPYMYPETCYTKFLDSRILAYWDARRSDTASPSSVDVQTYIYDFRLVGGFGFNDMGPELRTAMHRFGVKFSMKRKIGTKDDLFEEWRCLRNCNHEFIAKMHFYCCDNLYGYYVYEFLPPTLEAYLKKLKATLTVQQAVFTLAQVALAIDYLHRCRILYLRLDTKGIVVTSRGYVKLANFTNAIRLDQDEKDSTEAPQTVVTKKGEDMEEGQPKSRLTLEELKSRLGVLTYSPYYAAPEMVDVPVERINPREMEPRAPQDSCDWSSTPLFGEEPSTSGTAQGPTDEEQSKGESDNEESGKEGSSHPAAPQGTADGSLMVCFETDWWMLGILAYELVSRKVPFFSVNQNMLKVRIKQGILRFPDDFHKRNEEYTCLVRRLLTKEPESRLGHGEGGSLNVTTEIQHCARTMAFNNNTMFGLSWPHLYNKKYVSPLKRHSEPTTRPVATRAEDLEFPTE